MPLPDWLARFLTPEPTATLLRAKRRTASAAPSLFLRRLEDRRVLTATPMTVALTGTDATLAITGGHLTVTQNGTALLDVPKEDVLSLTINGTSAANTLTIDFRNGNPIPTGGLTFDGKDPATSPGDALVLIGGTFAKAVYTYTSAHDGTIALTQTPAQGGATSTITYRNLEPILNTGSATDIELVLSASADQAVLEDVGGGQLRLRNVNSASPTFETTTFTAPTGSLKILGGAGNDSFTVTPLSIPLSGSYTLTIDGETGTNTLIVDQINPSVISSNQFRFAGFTFDQANTPDIAVALPVSPTPLDPTGVVINSAVGAATGTASFPETSSGFNSALSVGRLINPSLTSGTLALNMPNLNDGTSKRSGIELSWSGGRTLTNESGADLVIYESSSSVGTQDAAMIQVHVFGGGWTKWYYQPKDARQNYVGDATQGAYATAIDLTNLGVAAGTKIDKIRYVNMIATDRMEGPGTEKVDGSGILVASGFVIPGEAHPTSNVLPDPGSDANYNYFGSTTLDPDPLYFGVLHPLGSLLTIPPGNDTVTVNDTSVAITTDGTPRTTVRYASMSTLQVLTRDGTDNISVSLQATLPTNILLNGGSSSDQVRLIGTTGAQTIALSGATAKVDGRTITFSNIEGLTVDTAIAGTGDSVTVDSSFRLSGSTPTLNVVGGGATTQNDSLTVSSAPQNFTVANVTFDQTATPNLYSDLPIGTLLGGNGVVVNTIPDKNQTTGTTSLATGFPAASSGFDNSLSLGALLERNASPATFRYMALPDIGNVGTTKRSGFTLSWSNDRVLRNSSDAAGEFVFYESGSAGTPEPVMVQVHNAQTGVWSNWIYKPATSSGVTSVGVAFATVYDLSDFGLAVGDTVDAVRVVNIIDADRMQSSTGVGIVLPGETRPGDVFPGQPVPISTTRPYAGTLASSPTYNSATGLDPDPMYFGALHGTVVNVSLDPDSVDIVGFMPIGYTGLAKVTLETGGDVDQLSITPSTVTQYVVRGGNPPITTNPGDKASLILAGVVDPTFYVTGIGTGTFTSATHKSIQFTGIDRFTPDRAIDVVVDSTSNESVGADTFLVKRNGSDDELFVNNQIVFRADITAIDNLLVNGSADADQLTVDRTAGNPVPTGGISFAAGSGNDTLRVLGLSATNITHTVSGATAGALNLDGSMIDYTGTETVIDTVAAAMRSFAFTGSGNVLSLADDVAVVAGLMEFSGNHTPLIRFTIPDKKLSIATGSGNDTLTVASVDAAYRAALAIDGQLGVDTIVFNAALTLGSALSTGDLSIAADKITLNKPVDTTLGTVGNVTFTVDDLLTVVGIADINAKGNVVVEGGSMQTSGDITTSLGDITIKSHTLLTGNVALVASTGDVSFSGLNATIDGTNGIPYGISISAPLGAVTFDADAGVSEALGIVSINAGLVVVNGLVRSDLGTPGSGTINIAADEIELNLGGGLDVVGGTVTLVSLTNDRPLTLGGNTASSPGNPSSLGLAADELTRIFAKTLRFGDNRAGAISVVGAPSLQNVQTLHLRTQRGVAGVGVITVTNLAITSVDDVSLTGLNEVGTLAAKVTGAGSDLSFRDADSLDLSKVDGIRGLSTNGGSTTLTTGAVLYQNPDGDITTDDLHLAGTGFFVLFDGSNHVQVLTASISGSLAYRDVDGLSIGSLTNADGIVTNGGSVVIYAGRTLNLFRPIDAGIGDVLLVSDRNIEDIGPATTKVKAHALDLGAITGIGTTRALETSVEYISAINLATGVIAIDDTSGTLLTIYAGGFSNDGDISVSHLGALKVAALVSGNRGGIALTTFANGGDDDDLVVNAPISISDGAGNIELQAATDLVVNAPISIVDGSGNIMLHAATDLLVNDTFDPGYDISTSGSGSIVGTAGRDVTIGPGVIISSATGKITGIPPLLTNVAGPQVANTGRASVSFDYGRLAEFHFTATVDWADGVVDSLGLANPGSSGATHVYTGNPNLSDPAAPIPITVILRSDDRIRFTGYETTTVVILVTFPGDGVRNVRIDTTAKVPQLTSPPPTRITDIPRTVATNISRSTVTGAAGLVGGADKSAERVVILREVFPDGREGSSVRFNQDALKDMTKIFAKLRNGRYRLYLYEPDAQKLRLVVDVYVRDGKPAAAGDARELPQDRPDGSRLDPPSRNIPADSSTVLSDVSDEAPDAEPKSPAKVSLAAGAAVVGAGLVVEADRPWHERVDAALSKLRTYSRIRSRKATRRPPR
ncbi:MAG: hypothetical protein K8U03_10135 [Planctomycetia bacterium]|nr:hypothetical protein [Planctomycetia bacterium]